MDMYFLLLLSFLSVFHLSTADQPLEETVVVAKKVKLLGGWMDANPEREDIQEAAKEAVEHFNGKSRAKKYFKLLHISSARTQVTNKINYKIGATIGKTKCLKSQDVDIDTCLMSKKKLACKFEVTLDPMNDEHQVQLVSCKKTS